jgi:hypothetical protein
MKEDYEEDEGSEEDYEEDEGSKEEVAPPPAKNQATKKKAETARAKPDRVKAEPVRMRAEPVPVKKEPKGRKAPKPRVAMRKGKGRAKDVEEEVQEIMDVDDEDKDENEKERVKRKPKPSLIRMYTRRGKFLFQFSKSPTDSSFRHRRTVCSARSPGCGPGGGIQGDGADEYPYRRTRDRSAPVYWCT